LDALLEERNITRAAEKLSLSQSAISGMLSRLREYFDDKLLTPVGRSMVLTPLAQELVEPVRNVLLHAQTVASITPAFTPQTARRHFRIATSDYVVHVLLRHVMVEIETSAPNITLEFLPQVEDSAEKLRRGDYDFLIIPEPFIADDQPFVPLFQDEYVCVIAKDNPVADGAFDLACYERLEHVSVLLGWPRTPTFESRFLDDRGIRRKVRVQASDFLSAASVVVGTRMVATMHARLARLAAQHLPLRIVPVPLPVPRVRECLQWHHYLDADPCHRWLRGVMANVAAKLPAANA
jgi:DNA-binding transcriptional LysR family regulator